MYIAPLARCITFFREIYVRNVDYCSQKEFFMMAMELFTPSNMTSQVFLASCFLLQTSLLSMWQNNNGGSNNMGRKNSRLGTGELTLQLIRFIISP